MKRAHSILMTIFIALALIFPWLSSTRSVSAEEAVVHAVMFWSEHCGYCHYVLENVLPPIQKKYGDQFDLLLLEVSTSAENVDRLFAAAKELGMSEDEVGVPFLIIGDRALVGADEIASQLPILIEEYLAAGGVGYPNLAALRDILPTPQSETSEPTGVEKPSTGQPIYSGIGLASVVLVGMVVALAFTATAFWRAFREDWAPRERTWMDRAVPLLVLVGIGIAGYLFYVEAQGVRAVCGPVGDCNAVQHSPYAKLFGVLPTSLLGIFGYLAILAAWWLQRLSNPNWAAYASLALFGFSLFGTLFSLYLTYVEIFILRAVCVWCLSSAVVMTLLMLLSLPPALQAAREFEEDEG